MTRNPLPRVQLRELQPKPYLQLSVVCGECYRMVRAGEGFQVVTRTYHETPATITGRHWPKCPASAGGSRAALARACQPCAFLDLGQKGLTRPADWVMAVRPGSQVVDWPASVAVHLGNWREEGISSINGPDASNQAGTCTFVLESPFHPDAGVRST